jgi:KipI family sensor histidine kinase inhibitor
LETPLPPLPPRILPLGDAAWTVEFGDAISPAINARVLGFSGIVNAEMKAGRCLGVIECVPTFRSLTVHFDPLSADALALRDALMILAQQEGSVLASGRRWALPVCFDDDFAPDLRDVAERKALSTDAVIGLLTGAVLRVYMLGFLPGFPYLGGLPDELNMPRLASPRTVVPERSVAITGKMCAIYPWQSPGGWRLVGRTPLRMFDAAKGDRPALLAPGDEIVLTAIDRESYSRIESACVAGEFDSGTLLLGPADAGKAGHE